MNGKIDKSGQLEINHWNDWRMQSRRNMNYPFPAEAIGL
jgi:hypothetical protein